MIVVDASVWVSRLVPQDTFHSTSRRWLEAYLAGGGRLVAPVLLPVEVAGAIARRTARPELGRQAAAQLLRIGGLRLVALDRRLGLLAIQLAGDLQLRGGDAVYVALAERLNIPFVTWDDEQRGRAAAHIATYTPATAPGPIGR